MKPDSDRITEIFARAQALQAPEQRKKFLAEVCGQDQDLRRQLESLLRAGEDAENFLGRTAAVPAPDLEGERAGVIIGRYQLLEKVGEGGFGAVYLAQQAEPVQRKVAVKIIKAGMDTKEVIARFEAERQALALMDHPNIARVLDGGATSQGRPYFVMELVKGIPLTHYSDQARLTTAERLKLFTKVCQAVQHAHQKGIIHRDLKPSNVLVTPQDGEPVPKVIDFGVAKALGQKLTEKTLFTGYEHMIGTPAYMSPEQAALSALDVDTRADIYSLGVLLYELLTGVTPFDKETLAQAGLDEVRRMILETDPPKPSTRLQTLGANLRQVANQRQTEAPKLLNLVRGDLDWIVMKCLEKDRGRRYGTANELARDVQRHLDNEPVMARPPSAGYKLRKLVRRKKIVFAASGAVLVSLVLGLAISTFSLIKEKSARERAMSAEEEQINLRRLAEAERQKVQIQAARSEQVSRFLKDMLEGVGPSVALGRDTTLLREILDQTAERIDKDLKTQPEVEAEMLTVMGNVYKALGEYTRAVQMQRQALSLWRSTLGEENAEVARSLTMLAEVLTSQKRLPEAEALLREALGMQRRLFPPEHPDLANTLNNLGHVLEGQHRLTEAELLLREALGMQQRLFGTVNAEVASSLGALGIVLRRMGKLEEAENMQREGLAIRRQIFGEEHPYVARSLNMVANVLRDRGKLEEAERDHRLALEIRRRVLGNQHPDVAMSLHHLALGLRLQGKGRLPEAEQLCRESLEMRRSLLGFTNSLETESLEALSAVLWQQGKQESVKALFHEELSLRREALGNRHPAVAASVRYLADFLRRQGHLEEAEGIYRELAELGNIEVQIALGSCYLRGEGVAKDAAEAAKWFRKAGDSGTLRGLNSQAWFHATCEDHSVRDGPRAVELAEKAVSLTDRKDALMLDTLAAAYAETGQFARAATVQREALGCLQEDRLKGEMVSRLKLYESEQPYREEAITPAWMAQVLRDQGKMTEAERVFRETLKRLRAQPVTNDLEIASALAGLASTLLDLNNFAEAESAAAECLAIRQRKIPESWLTFNTQSVLGGGLLGQKKYSEAESLLISGYEGMKARENEMPPAARNRLEEAHKRVIQLYEASGQTDKASEWRARQP